MANNNEYNNPESLADDTIKSSGAKQAAGAAGKALARAMKVAGKKAILLLAKFMIPVFIALAVLFFLFFFIYLIEYEFTGPEQKYTQDAENEILFNEDTNQYESKGLNSENSTIKDLYKYYAGKSYYQIVGKDNSKLISPDDDGAVVDYYGNEKVFALNENFLYSLDKFVFNEKFFYPEQFTKPVSYDKDTLTLKPITENGALTAVSKTPESLKSGIKTDTMTSVRDYGFGAIMKYNNSQDWKRTITMEGNYTRMDVWDSKNFKVVRKNITPEPFNHPIHSENINLLEKIITFKGEIEYQYNYQKSKIEKLYDGESDNPKAKVTKILYDTHIHVPKILVGHDVDGFPIYEDGKYEKYNLYKYRSSESGIYEDIPVASGNSVTDKGTDYLYDYLENFEANVPDNVITNYDFSERIDYDSSIFDNVSTMVMDYRIPFGASAKSPSLERSMQYFDLAAKHGAEFGVDPYLIVAMITQESGGDTNTSNGDGLMQITFSTPIKVKDASGVTKTVQLPFSSRRNPDLNIRMGTAYLKQMIDMFDGDIYKAVSAYNMGPGTISRIRTINPVAYADKYEWLLYREASRLISGGPGSRSISYDCIEFPGKAKTSGKVWGDSCYLEHVMRYYVDDASKMDDGGGSGLLNAVASFFRKFIRPEADESVLESDYRKTVKKNEVDDVLKMTIALDNKKIFSDINLEESFDELSFWDEGFMQSIGVSGLSLQDIMDITANADGFMPPVIMQNGARVTSKYGMRIHPTLNTAKMHTGVDIAAPLGTPIYASASGKVSHAKYLGTYGNVIFIDHQNGAQTRYAHLTSFNVSMGQEVTAGSVIGYMGSTGRSTGSHLHFELRVNGNTVDPMSIVMHQGTSNVDAQLGSKVLSTVKSQIGKDFDFKSSGPTSFSEMGLVSYVYQQSGYSDIPTSLNLLKTSGITVNSRTVKAGNILIIDGKYPAIYIGNDKMIFSSEALEKVVESVVYWDKVSRIISY